MTLVNVSSKEMVLKKIESDVFEVVEIHEMKMNDGLMSMREITDLVIPANGMVQLSPGGKHLMLKKPSQQLVSGQRVEMTLVTN